MFAPLNNRLPSHPRFTVLTGAGCSTGSGIPDYRDENGKWKRTPPVHLPDFLRDPLAAKRYWARSMAGWRSFSKARPNAVHDLLVRMERHGSAHHLITQNVDGLHQRAGATRVVDLHGRLDAVVCLDCRARSRREDLQSELEHLNPDWTYQIDQIAPDGDVDLSQVDYPRFRIVACHHCGGMLKPDVVFFGENVPRARVEFAFARVAEADALLIVGSSLMVYSGFRFARAAAEANKPIIILNRGRTRADDLATIKIEDDVLATLQAFWQWTRARQS